MENKKGYTLLINLRKISTKLIHFKEEACSGFPVPSFNHFFQRLVIQKLLFFASISF